MLRFHLLVVGTWSFNDSVSVVILQSHEDPSKLARRQQKAAKRKQREKELCRLHMAQEIQRQLEEVEQRQRDIEQKGIAVEKALRGESTG